VPRIHFFLVANVLRTWMAGTSPAMTSEKRTGYANLAVALPDQDQADGAEHGAISGPLQLIDHEARWRPRNHAGTLTDPQQADRKRQKADDRKRSGHGFPLVAVSDLGAAAALSCVAARKPLPAAAVASDRIQSGPA